jgi:hypothetical protein
LNTPMVTAAVAWTDTGTAMVTSSIATARMTGEGGATTARATGEDTALGGMTTGRR